MVIARDAKEKRLLLCVKSLRLMVGEQEKQYHLSHFDTESTFVVEKRLP